jgi:MULE transposase domain
VKVTILLLDHHCACSAPIAHAQASWLDWLQQVALTILKVEAKTTSKAIVDTVQLHFEHTIAAKQA